jgi:DNA-binding GntR family transcriptional regulator
VYQQLRERILQGIYPTGTALTEARAAQELGVSRTPVREAFSQLEQDGLVLSSPNKSLIVQGFSDQDILDLYDVRSCVESLAAGRAAEQMNAEQRGRLAAAYDEERQLTGAQEDTRALQELDSRFHDLIFQGSGSKILRNILSSIGCYTRQARTISLSTPGRSQNVLEEHGAILAAITQGDRTAAQAQMRRHIARAAESYQTISKNRRPTG